MDHMWSSKDVVTDIQKEPNQEIDLVLPPNLIIYVFKTAFGLHMGFLCRGRQVALQFRCLGFFFAVSSLLAHRLRVPGLSSCSSWAWLFLGTWDLPG